MGRIATLSRCLAKLLTNAVFFFEIVQLGWRFQPRSRFLVCFSFHAFGSGCTQTHNQNRTLRPSYSPLIFTAWPSTEGRLFLNNAQFVTDAANLALSVCVIISVDHPTERLIRHYKQGRNCGVRAATRRRDYRSSARCVVLHTWQRYRAPRCDVPQSSRAPIADA